MDSEQTAEEVLSALRDKYVEPEKADEYDKVYYGQKIKIKQIRYNSGQADEQKQRHQYT